MKATKSIKENFVMNIVLMGSAYILPFLMTPYVSRILMPEGMGKISCNICFNIFYNVRHVRSPNL